MKWHSLLLRHQVYCIAVTPLISRALFASAELAWLWVKTIPFLVSLFLLILVILKNVGHRFKPGHPLKQGFSGTPDS